MCMKYLSVVGRKGWKTREKKNETDLLAGAGRTQSIGGEKWTKGF